MAGGIETPTRGSILLDMHTILVVDDEPQIVKVVRGYLEQAGFRVVTAADGPGALAQFRHEKPDLVVLDLNLPGLDGIDVALIGAGGVIGADGAPNPGPGCHADCDADGTC